ncbi:MAG: Fic family protein [Alphaproteobacteria bacterium]|nr:Fic family protein [Alphaproteobacteria bacterium]MBV9862767.1 Fic family protein [Alphaproteobacteria bacterium]
MASEPTWLPLDAVTALNRDIVAESGETYQLRDRASLQKAVDQPWNIWCYFQDRDMAVLASRLFSGIANARAFAAGNKRTGYRAALAFLDANGYELGAPDYAVGKLGDYFAGHLSQYALVDWFRLWMTPHTQGRIDP